MDTKDQIIDLVEKFLIIADSLLKSGKIDRQTYDLMTENKIKFLEFVGVESKYYREQENG